MSYLMDILAGKPESDLERAIDRFFVGQTAGNVVSSFFDPERRKRTLEEQALERYLTSDSYLTKNDVITAAAALKPAKTFIAHILKG